MKHIREPLPGSTCVRHGAPSKSKPSKPSGTSQKIVRFPTALVGISAHLGHFICFGIKTVSHNARSATSHKCNSMSEKDFLTLTIYVLISL